MNPGRDTGVFNKRRNFQPTFWIVLEFRETLLTKALVKRLENEHQGCKGMVSSLIPVLTYLPPHIIG
jgi:hypothetical protein